MKIKNSMTYVYLFFNNNCLGSSIRTIIASAQIILCDCVIKHRATAFDTGSGLIGVALVSAFQVFEQYECIANNLPFVIPFLSTGCGTKLSY